MSEAILTFLTEGWIGKTTIAGLALATVLAMGLMELAMTLGFKTEVIIESKP